MRSDILKWLRENAITEVEAFFPDFSGIARGKIVPAEKIVTDTVRLPESAIAQSVTGDWHMQEEFLDEADTDMTLSPDACSLAPWAASGERVAQLICDCENNGRLIRWAPRSILKRVLRAYQKQGWRPVVAPELEFYLAARDNNPDNPLRPPAGQTGWPEFSSQPFSIDAVNEFDPVIDDIYRFAEAQDLAVDTLTHEEGAAQFEINFAHGDALEMADQTLLFKRCVREAAKRHGLTATFMAKPAQEQPGSSMHLHMSVVGRDGKNLFAGGGDGFSPLFLGFIGGLQKYLGDAAPLFWPNVNSFRRLHIEWPTVNAHWGVNNRTVGFRVPQVSDPAARRIEARVCGADANPYLAIAGALWSGFCGLRDRVKPLPQARGAGWDIEPRGVAQNLEEALTQMRKSKFCATLSATASSIFTRPPNAPNSKTTNMLSVRGSASFCCIRHENPPRRGRRRARPRVWARLSADFNRALGGPGMLGDAHGQNAFGQVGVDFVGFDIGRQAETARKRSGQPLGAQHLGAFGFFFARELAGDAQNAVFERHRDILFFDAGHLGADEIRFFVLFDIGAEKPAAGGFRRGLEIVEKAPRERFEGLV